MSERDRAAIDLLDGTVDAVAAALRTFSDEHPERWRDPGERPGQYALDLVADRAALDVLERAELDGAPVGVLSEESGLQGGDRAVVVVVDPVDGSTNASRRIPWYACSLAAVDADGVHVAVVANLATGVRYRAVRGAGATRDGQPITASTQADPARSVLVLNGYAGAHAGWRQYRTLGAMALDLCAVADGSFDGSMDCTVDAINPWDYLGGVLVLTEAGGHVRDVQDRPLVDLGTDVRRTLVSAGSAALLEELLQRRRSLPPGRPRRTSDSGTP
jgi:fructose-1,6-bisphosphatase/inositol monophosphatase family enzyme